MEMDRTCFRMKVILALCEQPLSRPLSITNNHYLTGLPVVNAVYKMSFIFFLGGVFLGSHSGGAPSGSSNLYTISEQYL